MNVVEELQKNKKLGSQEDADEYLKRSSCTKTPR